MPLEALSDLLFCRHATTAIKLCWYYLPNFLRGKAGVSEFIAFANYEDISSGSHIHLVQRYLRSPHFIPALVKSSKSVVAEQHARIEPYIIGMKPCLLYVNAHQHVPVIDIISTVDTQTG